MWVHWEGLLETREFCDCPACKSGSSACGSGKPLQQERRDWMWLGRCGWDSGPYPDEACQGTQAYLAGDGEEAGGGPQQGEVALLPHSTSPHGDPAWACKVGRKLPSCLGEEGEERTTIYPCISDMQLNNMHYYCTQRLLSHTNLKLLLQSFSETDSICYFLLRTQEAVV